MTHKFAFVGFGEVGNVLAKDLKIHGYTITAFDLKFGDLESPPYKNANQQGVKICEKATQAVCNADIIFSAVTANQTIEAALSVRDAIKPNSWYVDVNSASPETKCRAAEMIDGAGGRYIEASIMSPIHPKGITSPIILAGPHAKKFEAIANDLGFSRTQFYSTTPGKAAAAKLCRSIVVKGMETLITESLLAARSYGVEEFVLSSLENLFPHPNWKKHAHYMITRSVLHGDRRSEEMQEATKTVQSIGCSPIMSSACADRQKLSAAFSAYSQETDLNDLLDVMLVKANEDKPL